MAKTVQEHFEECKQIDQIVDQANALLTKVRNELVIARAVLEALSEYQHPKLAMAVPYQFRQDLGDKHVTPRTVIDAEITRINALLGDRA
ncbi:hypothetical protein GCM10011360_17830 [Primorskyibacter flagellatus]|uniref:Uncharacterized protein n=1 Tax=Primorskyibacter flagellatus TaxID=1387277 RepID=A0A917EER8_9RHOB|nr:hypothetical protein [Primorskyibacter flagellatus]GGE30210.1 hypothetical protein GCM10011360_17830 [Primorskyibacter flagellatus]